MKITEDIEFKRPIVADDDQWALGATTSLEGLSDTSEGERPKQNLQIIPKQELKSSRPRLKASLWDILSFFRVYTTSICKTQIISLGEDNINWFFWYRVLNLIFSSLPHVFVQVFLAAYVPDQHFYLNKMNPLTWGYNIVVILATFFEIVLFMNSNILLIDYFWEGLYRKSPWKRCTSNMTFVTKGVRHEAVCYNLKDFVNRIQKADAGNQTLHFLHRAYYYQGANGSESFFQLSHIVHLRERMDIKYDSYRGSIFLFYFILVWIFAAIHYNQLFKKLIWKVLTISHYVEAGIAVLIFFYIHIYDSTILYYNPPETIIKAVIKQQAPLVDIDFIALALNSPPLAQFLISRTTKDHSKIQYESLSVLLVVSNWCYGFFTAFLGNTIKRYCEADLGVVLHYSYMDATFFFYLYPIFFGRFFLGNIFFAITLLAKLLSDFYTFIITYHCLVETIVCEWRFTSRVFIQASVTLAGLLVYIFSKFSLQLSLYLYCKLTVILVEALGIYLLYPLDRLIEDITFYRGSPPSSLRIWSLRIVLTYVSVKSYTIVKQIDQINILRSSNSFWILVIVPLCLGAVLKIFAHLCVDKKIWAALFRPEPHWGPADNVLRYCRKIFKSDEYIGSQADRVLSRYMLSKTESETVHLDIKYEVNKLSLPTTLMRYEDEKKNV